MLGMSKLRRLALAAYVIAPAATRRRLRCITLAFSRRRGAKRRGNRKQAKRACRGRLQGVVGRHVTEAEFDPRQRTDAARLPDSPH